jgi:hypothetical protein
MNAKLPVAKLKPVCFTNIVSRASLQNLVESSTFDRTLFADGTFRVIILSYRNIFYIYSHVHTLTYLKTILIFKSRIQF